MKHTSDVQMIAGMNFKMIQQKLQFFKVDWNGLKMVMIFCLSY